MTTLPPHLLARLGDVAIEEVLYSTRRRPFREVFPLLAFGTFWTLFSLIFVVVFFGPLFTEGEVHFEANGVPTTASWENLTPLLPPVLFILLFLLIGIGMIGTAWYLTFQRGGFYVITPNKLFLVSDKEMRSWEWSHFSEEIQVRGNDRRGTVTLFLRSRSIPFSRGRGAVRKNVVFLVHIPRPYEVAQLLRRRIQEVGGKV